MATKILTARARLDDSTAMDALISPIPNGEQLRQSLRARPYGSKQAYHEETRTARYVAADGELAVCFTATDLTLEQAATIAAECDAITEWNFSAFQAAVERALRASVDRVQ